MQIDAAGTSTRTAEPSPEKRAKGGSGSSDQTKKVVLAAAIGVIALAVIAYQVVPMFSSSSGIANQNAPDLTEPVQPDTTGVVPGAVVEPIVPKPRGSGKRPVGG